MISTSAELTVAVACGGTGGHLFPGMAVGAEMARLGCNVTLMVSEKEVDQSAVRSQREMDVVTLPSVGMKRGGWIQFARGFWHAYIQARAWCRIHRPAAILGMGGFTSAPPVFAARRQGAATALHESNRIPGRANRLLAPWVGLCFTGFPAAGNRLWNSRIVVTGTPVRSQFAPIEAATARISLGLSPLDPVLLITGGSQGASRVNELVLQAAPELARRFPKLQFLHLTGEAGCAGAREVYSGLGRRAVVRPFLTEMELALGAATVAVSRSGAGSLAELAAMQVPAILIPYPAAADNHQLHNAREFVSAGAALLVPQSEGAGLLPTVGQLLSDATARERLRSGLRSLQAPHAAEIIAMRLMVEIERRGFSRPTRRDPADDDFSDDSQAASQPRLPHLLSQATPTHV